LTPDTMHTDFWKLCFIYVYVDENFFLFYLQR